MIYASATGQVDTMKCKQYGRCSNFDDTECSGEDGSTPIACSHFSKIDLVRELCSREGVVEYDFSSGEFYSLKSGNYREKLLGLLEMKDGPVKIIVVRGYE